TGRPSGRRAGGGSARRRATRRARPPRSPPGSRGRSPAPGPWRGRFAVPSGAASPAAPSAVDPCSRALDHSSVVSRVFTPEEANAALAALRPLVRARVEAKRRLDEAQERRDDVAQQIAGNGGGIPPAELATLEHEVNEAATELAAAMGEVQALGVLVKDLDAGLADFPANGHGE